MKRKVAFLLSVDRLFEQCKRVYLWTFTFRQVVSDEVAFKCWNHLNANLQYKYGRGNCPGVRVVEVHPGGHGLHFHALIGRWLQVQDVRRLSIKAGFGRIHVRECDKNAAEYLAKYLNKNQPGLKKGCRRWGMVGGFQGTKVRNIVVESTLADNCRRVGEVLGFWGQGLYYEVRRLTMLYGHCTEWPVFPALTEKPRVQRGDADESGHVEGLRKDGTRVRFSWVKVRDNEIGEYVHALVPAQVAEPF